jgi:RNA polymerase sigma-70 factor (ECF subfamily)
LKSDYLLAQRILRGDEKALRVFYDAHFERIYHFVLTRVDLDHQRAEEVVQETFLSGLRGLPRYSGESSLYSWLCGIAKHKAVDNLRLQARRSRQEVPFSALAGSEEGRAFEIQDRSAPYEQAELVHRTLFALPSHYRSVLTHKYIEEQTTKEIAAAAGRSAKAVESLLTRARNAFRKAFLLIQQEASPGT